MPKKTNRRSKLKKWAKKNQRGGFVFSTAAIIAAISAGISAAAPVVGTAALGSATAYGVNKVLTKVGGRRRRIRM